MVFWQCRFLKNYYVPYRHQCVVATIDRLVRGLQKVMLDLHAQM